MNYYVAPAVRDGKVSIFWEKGVKARAQRWESNLWCHQEKVENGDFAKSISLQIFRVIAELQCSPSVSQSASVHAAAETEGQLVFKMSFIGLLPQTLWLFSIYSLVWFRQGLCRVVLCDFNEENWRALTTCLCHSSYDKSLFIIFGATESPSDIVCTFPSLWFPCREWRVQAAVISLYCLFFFIGVKTTQSTF